MFGTVIVPLTRRYASLESHEFHRIIEILNLMSLLALYLSRDSSFISTQFLILNLHGSFVVSSYKIIVF